MQRAEPAKKKDEIPPLRMVLLAATTLMALYVGYLVFGGSDEPDAGDLATTQTKLFAELPRGDLRNPIECDTRAHDAYGRAKKLAAQAGADPGNYYRAALEFDKAVRFREQSGRPLADMADVGALEREGPRARPRPSSRTPSSACRAPSPPGDLKRCAAEAALLARIVPDPAAPLPRQARRLPPHAAAGAEMRRRLRCLRALARRRAAGGHLRAEAAGLAAREEAGREPQRPRASTSQLGEEAEATGDLLRAEQYYLRAEALGSPRTRCCRASCACW